MIAPPPIEVRQLRKVFRQTASGQPVVAIDRLDLDVAPREVLAIVGQTGCGKSTFFDLMIGLEQPTAGSIRIADLRTCPQRIYIKSAADIQEIRSRDRPHFWLSQE